MAAAVEPLPDDLRCRRSDGRGWRCKRPALHGFTNCETHLSKAQRRRFVRGDPLPSNPFRRGRPRRPSDPQLPPSDQCEGKMNGSLEDLVRMEITKKKRRGRVPVADGSLSVRVLPIGPAMGDPQNRLAIDHEVNGNPLDVTVPIGRASTVEEEVQNRVLEVANGGYEAVEVLTERERSDGCEVVGRVGCLESSGDVPEDLRCRRTDGKRWRCRRQAMNNHYYCELHHIQAYRRQHKLGVPESLKLRRGRAPGDKKPKVSMVWKKRKREEEGGGLDEVEEKRRKREERPLATLVRMVMRRRGRRTKVRKEGMSIGSKMVLKSPPVAGIESVPEHLRCRRTDGKRWRCSHRALDNLSFCEIHHIQAYRRQYKLGVPESLKLKRRPRGSSVHPRRSNWMLGKRKEDMNEDELRRAVKMEKRRKENETLLVEVMRMVLRRQMEKRKKRQKRREEEGEMTPECVKKALPNGLMSISPVVSGNLHHVGEHLDMKIGLDSSSFLRWCFRSKNVDPPPIGSLQMLPYARKAVGLGKRRRRVCHHCRASPVGRILRCSHCRKAFFCKSCIKKWYFELSESDVRMSCPICRGKCRCGLCTSVKSKDQSLYYC